MNSAVARVVAALAAALAAAFLPAAAPVTHAADAAKVLRVASADLETLDPHQYNDSPSFDVISAIYEGLYEWDYLASSPNLSPVGERIALRRAIALAFDTKSMIKVVYAGQAVAANQLVPPGVTGHDPALPPRPPHDPEAANALLDRLGYRPQKFQTYWKFMDIDLARRSAAGAK